MRSPSELEAVDMASGDLRAIIGEDKGVSKSSSDSGLVNGLVSTVEATAATGAAVLEAAAFTVALAVVGITVASAEAVEVGINGALICEDDALSSEASELVSDRVGLPPTFSL